MYACSRKTPFLSRFVTYKYIKEEIIKSRFIVVSAALSLLSLNVIHAASYGYGVQCNKATTSGYTYATNDDCSIETVSFYTHDGKNITKMSKQVDHRDPATNYATTLRKLPSGGLYFTRIEGTHSVGKNVYHSSDNFDPDA